MVRYDVHMWVDEELEATRMDTLNGIDKTLNLGVYQIMLYVSICNSISLAYYLLSSLISHTVGSCKLLNLKLNNQLVTRRNILY